MGVYVDTPPVHPPTHKIKQEMKKRKSGKAKNRPTGVERKPLILKSTFTDACIAELAKHFLNPREQRFVPDGRWVVETRQNGKFLTFTSFLVSFD